MQPIAHDAAVNMTTVPKPWDPANGMTCIYDAWNRLVEVKVGETTIQRDGPQAYLRPYVAAN